VATTYVIPAAGNGTRFRLAGFNDPKPRIRVLGIPMIVWPISNLPLSEGDSLIIVTKSEDNLPVHLAPWLERVPCTHSFLTIDKLSDGPASTVAAAFEMIDPNQPLVVLNSDQYISGSLTEFFTELNDGELKERGVILTMKASGAKWSYVRRDSNRRITEVVEKREVSNEATVGVYGWTRAHLAMTSYNQMLKANFRVNNEFYVAPTYNYLLSMQIDVVTVEVGEIERSVHGLGTPQDLQTFLALDEMSERANAIRESYHPA
jgi:dTDP-glucose pyrophosphorylase